MSVVAISRVRIEKRPFRRRHQGSAATIPHTIVGNQLGITNDLQRDGDKAEIQLLNLNPRYDGNGFPVPSLCSRTLVSPMGQLSNLENIAGGDAMPLVGSQSIPSSPRKDVQEIEPRLSPSAIVSQAK